MLINKAKYAVNDIVTLRLSNGDEIVGKLIEVSDTSITLERPRQVQYIPTNNGLGLIPCVFSVDPDTTFEFNRTHILLIAETMQQMAEHYIQTTTGIAPVTKGKIVV